MGIKVTPNATITVSADGSSGQGNNVPDLATPGELAGARAAAATNSAAADGFGDTSISQAASLNSPGEIFRANQAAASTANSAGAPSPAASLNSPGEMNRANAASTAAFNSLNSPRELAGGIPSSTVAPSTAAGGTGTDTGTGTGASVTGDTSTSAGSVPSSGGGLTTPGNDFRIRLRPLNWEVYGNTKDSSNILAPLVNTSGLLFPFTPQITFQQEVNYADVALTHSNMDYLGYTRTPSVTLTISGKFSVQTQQQGAYALAALHFCRVVSKMYFGKAAADRIGLPPPVLVLSGYGTYMFNDLRCFLKSHSYAYDQQMDLVPVYAGGSVTRLPALFDLSVTVTVQQTPRKMRENFDLNKFRTGELMRTDTGWI